MVKIFKKLEDKYLSLRNMFTVLFCLFAMLPACILGSITTYMNIVANQNTMIHNNAIITKQLSQEIENTLEKSQGMTVTAASAIGGAAIDHKLDAQLAKTVIIEMQKQNPEIELIYANDITGMQIARTSGQLRSQSKALNFIKTTTENSTWFSDVFISATTHIPTITLYTPIRDQTNSVIGMLASSISLKQLEQMAGGIQIGQNGYVDVVDGKGRLLTHPVKERVQAMESIANLSYVNKVLAGSSGSIEGDSTTGVPSIITFCPIAQYGWGVITYMPKNEIHSVVLKNVSIIIGFLVVSILLAGIIAFYIARGIARPLQEIAVTASELAQGDLTPEIHGRGTLETKQLATALTQMKTEFKKIIYDIVTTAEQVAAASQQLTASAKQSGQAAHQVASSIADVASGADRQIGTIGETTIAIDQMSFNIKKIADRTTTVSRVSDNTEKSANQGEKTVHLAIQQMENIEKNVMYSTQIITNLDARSAEISGIVNTIVGIARQTNLLALNAAIEAARAGQEGRGFAVVADEIRKLAEESQKSAKQIAELVFTVQSDTKEAVSAMNIGTNEVEVGIQVVNNAGEAFREIALSVKSMSVQLHEISQEIQQIAVNSQKIVTTVHHVDEIGKNTAIKTQNISAATQEQVASIEEFSNSSQVLSEMAKVLQYAVLRFKI